MIGARAASVSVWTGEPGDERVIGVGIGNQLGVAPGVGISSWLS